MSNFERAAWFAAGTIFGAATLLATALTIANLESIGCC